MLSLFRRSDAGPSSITPHEFSEKRTEDDVVLDVRTPGEFAAGHVAGSTNMNLHAPDFREQIDGLDRDRTYYVYCRSGARSGTAVRMMREMGFHNALNAGGLNALVRAGVKTSG